MKPIVFAALFAAAAALSAPDALAAGTLTVAMTVLLPPSMTETVLLFIFAT